MTDNFDSNFNPQVPLPNINDSTTAELISLIASTNFADNFYSQLVHWINEFNRTIDDNFEVGVVLGNFGQTYVFHLLDIGFNNPSLIIFYGLTEQNEPVRLIQHVNQISILLLKLPRKEPNKPKKVFGFQVNP
ncbi:DUF6173 domain-containing protein [Nostoc sp. DSM 114160]|jgi:hypothetical protein